MDNPCTLPDDETVRHFQALQRQIKTSRRRGTHVRYMCSELAEMLRTYPALRDILDRDVEGTLRYHTR